MNKFRNKLVSVALAGTTMLSLSGAIIPVAHAQSVADLQAQIAALLVQIQQLQTQLNASIGVSAAPSFSFTRDLTVGSKGDDVKALQQFLNANGAQLASSGAGSPGGETSFFGPLTRAALAKYQAANGISPPAGYFGPITRSFLKTLAAAPSVPGAPAPSVLAPASGLAVGLASDNPAAGSLISSSGSAAARVPVLAVNLTAGVASGITISELKFKKVGVLSDSSIAGAYLTEKGLVVAQYNSISNGVINFSGLALNVAAGQTRALFLAIDPATGLSAGNTVGFSLNSASDVMAVDAANASVAPSGAFPLAGNTFTVTSVSNPSIASLTIASSSIGTEVTAGTNNNLVGAWNFTVTNSKVNLHGINFKVIGSANKTDLRNVKLTVNGTQAGSSLAQVAANGDAYFDLSSNPGVLNTGSNNIQLFADIAGSPSFNFQFEILNAYEVLALDSQYNVPISAQSNVGTQISIKTGSITVSQATDTPTGNVAAGQSSMVFAKFTIFAGGEAVKVKWLGIGLNFTGATLGIDSQVRNLSLTDDAGGQVGTTINTLSTSVTCTNTIFSDSTSTYRNCFGNNSSPINYIVPANTTRVLSLKGDIQSTADFTTITGLLTGNTSNLQGLTSSQTASSASANGAALTRAASSLTVAANSALGTQTVAINATGLRIGSYALSASSAEGVTVNNLSIQARGGSWTNLRVKIDGAQFGSTQGTVSSGTTYSFSGSPFTVPAGTTKFVDVYADSISSASGSISPASVLTGCSASGGTSLTAISCDSTNGQGVVFAGQATITVAIDSASPAASQLVMGSSGNVLGIFRFTETSNVENVKITDLAVFQTVETTGTVKAAFGNVKLYNSSGALLGTAGSAITAASTTGYYYLFNFASPVVVPQANSISLTLKGDLASYSSSGATDNTTHVFKIAIAPGTAAIDTAAEVVVALGATSNATSAVTISSANANEMTSLRSKLTVSATQLGATSARSKNSTDILANLTFTADSAGSVQISSVTITFSGSAPSGVDFFDGTTPAPTLYDAAVGTSYAISTSTATTMSYDLSDYQLSSGASKNFELRIDSLSTTEITLGASGISQTLSATINAVGDVTWKDSLDSAASTGLNLESVTVPLQISSVSYAQGT